MTENKKLMMRDSLFGFTAAGKVLSCALAFAGCLSLNIYSALICCAACFILSVFLKEKILCPDAFLTVPLVYAATLFGTSALPATLILAAVLFVPFAFSLKKTGGTVKIPDGIMLGMFVGLAFSVTALMTTYYFGIGATGATVLEMLKNYRYLGFHPNWRGVFYGTITLFLMITYPFKFRKLSKYLPVEAVSLFVPFVLNLLLNPDGETTPILELGTLASLKSVSGINGFLPIAGTAFSSPAAFSAELRSAFALAVILALFYAYNGGKELAATAGANAVSGVFGGIPASPAPIKKYSVSAAAVAVVSAAALVLACPSPISRMPLHSLAVVLIVSAWQHVPFGRFGQMFKTEKVFGALLFVVCAASFVVFDIFKASAVCAVLAVLMTSRGRKTV